ncbi:hypothetical protein J4227_04280 [Candidatus Woesearchaeota archaeon]|nr:hypothetical protein [Candidatus Woesearchaeota archaeon]
MRQSKGKVKLVGLTMVCPYCGKPSEEISLVSKLRAAEIKKPHKAAEIKELLVDNLGAGMDYQKSALRLYFEVN